MHEGWKNYETWATNLWITNEEGTNDRVMDIARHTKEVYATSEAIKDYVEDEMLADQIEKCGGTLAGDLLGAALSEVDFAEIAHAFLITVRENDTEDDAA